MQGKIKKAMVLAAGYGTRLKPLTNAQPKALVPVAGKPMIAYALEKLQDYGIEEVVINVSHLKEPLIDYLSAWRRFSVRISEEPEPLETGGGLKNALPLLGNDPFFTVNCDIVWTDNGESALHRLARLWDGATMDALLLIQSKAKAVGHERGEDHVFISPANTLEWDDRASPYVIAGVGILHPRLLRDAPEGKFSVKVLWREALERRRLACLPHTGAWFQTGTPEDVARTETYLKQ